MSLQNCDVVRVRCDPTSPETACKSCATPSNFACVKESKEGEEEEYFCKRIAQLDYNPFLEYLVVDNSGKLVYECRYPEFASNNGDNSKPCRILHACPPTGLLKEAQTDRVITSARQIDKGLWNYACSCGTDRVPVFDLYPRCRMATVEDLLNNVAEYSKYGCLYYPNDFAALTCHCPFNHVRNEEKAMVDAGYKPSTAYDVSLLPPTCVKKPCEYDPVTGQKVVGSWDAEYKTCRCDTSRGVVGVFVNEAGNGNAANVKSEADGFNACVLTSDDGMLTKASFLRYYVDTPQPKIFYFPKKANDHKFPLAETSLTYFQHAFPEYKDAHYYFSPIFRTRVNVYVPDFMGEFPLDMDTMTTSERGMRPFKPNQEDSLFITVDDTYDHPFLQVGDLARAPATFDIEHEGTIINPYIAIAGLTARILDFSEDKIKNTDLVGLPRKKKQKINEER